MNINVTKQQFKNESSVKTVSQKKKEFKKFVVLHVCLSVTLWISFNFFVVLNNLVFSRMGTVYKCGCSAGHISFCS